MKLVVISPASDDVREHHVLRGLFAAGLEHYHVRKPSWSREQLATWLRTLPPEWRAKLVLHQHHELVAALGLGGVHFRDEVGRGVPAEPSRMPLANHVGSILHAARATAQPEASPHPYPTSRSCHDLATLRASLGHYDSVFLSPLFPSISKPGYGPGGNLSHAEIAALLAARTPAERRTTVLALGGITAARLPAVRALGFDGAAVLGALWQAANPVQAFAELQDALCCHAA